MNESNNTPPAFIPSPCIGKCGLNAQEICRGCFRSMSEILNWERMSIADKRATLENCKQRRLQRIAGQIQR